jgi:two-component system cell cycle sensor histidine kinase/response regulator CckA
MFEDRSREDLLAELVTLQQRLAHGEADRSERRRAEAFLDSTLKQLRNLEAIVNRGPAVIAVWRVLADDLATDFVSENVEQFGYTARQLISGEATWLGMVHPEDRARVQDVVMSYSPQAASELALQYRVVRPSGEARWVESRIVPWPEPDAAATHLQGISVDITERRHAEETLASERGMLRTLIDSLPVTVYVKDTQSRFVLGNRALVCSMGAETLDDLIGKTDFDFYPQHLAETYRADELRVMQSGEAMIDAEERSVRPDGTLYWALSTKVPLRDGQGCIVGLVGIGQDITRRKQQDQELARHRYHLEQLVEERTADLSRANCQLTEQIAERERAEQALAADRTLLRTLFDNLPDAVYVKDRESRFLAANSRVARIMGTTPDGLLGKTDFDFYPAELARRYLADEQSVMQSGQPIVDREEPVRDAEGNLYRYLTTKVPVRDAAGQVTGVVGIGHDMSERQRAEEEHTRLQAQFLQAQKMEAVGRLTAGVAHDFNNLLTVINGYAARLQDRLPPNDPLHDAATRIADAGGRGVELVRHLMTFSRREVRGAHQAVQLDRVIADLDVMLRRVIGEDILLETVAAPDLWSVGLSAPQVEQIIVNLAVNARDAMRQGGRLTISAVNTVLGGDAASRLVDIEPGDCVRLRISDTGTGMTDEVQAHLFEPYFTTKERGKGTGLGLATVYGIVRQAGGAIEVDSQLGRGTTFTIYLPRVTEDPGACP